MRPVARMFENSTARGSDRSIDNLVVRDEINRHRRLVRSPQPGRPHDVRRQQRLHRAPHGPNLAARIDSVAGRHRQAPGPKASVPCAIEPTMFDFSPTSAPD